MDELLPIPGSVDRPETDQKEVRYLRERTKRRLDVMRAMNSPRAGASRRVLRLYYVQAVRCVADYASVALVSLFASSREALETVQNPAMRTILGEPNWTNLATMRAELCLPPFVVRVDQLTATLVTRTINRPTNKPGLGFLVSALPQDARVFTEKT